MYVSVHNICLCIFITHIHTQHIHTYIKYVNAYVNTRIHVCENATTLYDYMKKNKSFFTNKTHVATYVSKMQKHFFLDQLNRPFINKMMVCVQVLKTEN